MRDIRMSIHLAAELAYVHRRGFVWRRLPPVDDMLFIIDQMNETTRSRALDVLMSERLLGRGDSVPGCPCELCTGIPAFERPPTWTERTPVGAWRRDRERRWRGRVEEARAIPILDVARRLGIEVRKAGKTTMARCPFHDDKTPSLSLSPEKNAWYCFSCGRGGDGLRLVMDVRRLDFVEAVKELTGGIHPKERIGV